MEKQSRWKCSEEREKKEETNFNDDGSHDPCSFGLHDGPMLPHTRREEESRKNDRQNKTKRITDKQRETYQSKTTIQTGKEKLNF